MECPVCNIEFKTHKELTKHLVEEHDYSIGQIYDYFCYSFENKSAKCPICGKEFTLSKKQIRNHKKDVTSISCCCLSCTRSLYSMFYGSPFSRPDVRQKSKQTMLMKYGVEYSFQSGEIQKKSKETLLNKYGIDNIQKLPEVREQIKKTCLERYGTDSPAKSESIKEKIRQTNLRKYGVESTTQDFKVKQKIRQASLRKYGVENPSQSNEVKDRRKRTFKGKYGVECPSQIPEIKDIMHERMKKANLKKYGVEYPTKSKEIMEKMKKTNLEKYGCEYTVNVPEFQEKAKQTNLEKYGVENVFQNEEIREKAKKSNLEKYGVEHASSSPEIKDKVRKINLEKYGVEYFCQHESCYGKSQRISQENKNFQQVLSENGIDSELEYILENHGYDIRVGNILIEINPYVTHNSTWGPCFGGKIKPPKPIDYHSSKTVLAKKYGFQCIHVFDWDSKDKVINFLKKKKAIYARQCVVQEVKRKDADIFLGKYHIQGSTKQIKHAYGLFYQDELVQVMTFGKPRYNKNYEYELLRLCTLPELNVIGGASKLLKYFEEQVRPESIISYCDLSKFTGDVYKKLKFSFVTQTSPTRHWYNPKTKVHITDNLLRQRGFDQLHKTSFGKGTSNEELMKEHGYVEIYDCGQLVFGKYLV